MKPSEKLQRDKKDQVESRMQVLRLAFVHTTVPHDVQGYNNPTDLFFEVVETMLSGAFDAGAYLGRVHFHTPAAETAKAED